MMRTPSGDSEANTVRGSTSAGILDRDRRQDREGRCRCQQECFMGLDLKPEREEKEETSVQVRLSS